MAPIRGPSPGLIGLGSPLIYFQPTGIVPSEPVFGQGFSLGVFHHSMATGANRSTGQSEIAGQCPPKRLHQLDPAAAQGTRFSWLGRARRETPTALCQFS